MADAEETRTYAKAASEIINALNTLLEVAAEIDSLVAELRKLEADKTMADVKKAKKKVVLHKTLATEIRRYVHLYQFKMKNTWDKLQQMQRSEDKDYTCQTMPPMEKLTIHTDVGSGIEIKLLKELLTQPIGRFAVFYRWLQNRLHYWTCCGTTLPPPVRKHCLGETIVFDKSPPKTTDDADSCPTTVSPVTRPELNNSNSSIELFQVDDLNLVTFEQEINEMAVPSSSTKSGSIVSSTAVATPINPTISNQGHPTLVPYDDDSDDGETDVAATEPSSVITLSNHQTEHQSSLVPYSDSDESDYDV